MSQDPYLSNVQVQPPKLTKTPEMMPPPGYFRPWKPKTEEGVKFAYWALLIYVIALLCSILIGIAMYFMVSALISSTNPDEGLFGALMLLLGVAFAIIALFIIVLVFWIMGIVSIYKGKEEFGPEHTRKVKLSVKFLIAGIILYIANAIIGVILVMSTLSFGLPSQQTSIQEMYNQLMLMTVVTGIVGIVAAIFIAFHIIYMIIGLSDEKHKKMLWSAFAINLIAMVLTLIFSIWLISLSWDAVATMDYSHYSTWSQSISYAQNVLSVISLVAFALVLVCYRSAYLRVKNGEIKPMPLPVPQYYAPPPI